MGTYSVPIRITYPGAGGPGYNIWHARTTGNEGDNPDVDLGTLMTLLHNFYLDLRPIFTPATQFLWEGVATSVHDPANQATNVAPWTVTGQAPQGTLLPSATQICVGWRTESAARSAVGRTFVGPLASGCLDNAGDGTPSAGTRQLVADVAQVLVNNSTTFTNGAWGVYSRQFDVFHDVTAVRVRKQFAVLTSRRD